MGSNNKNNNGDIATMDVASIIKPQVSSEKEAGGRITNVLAKENDVKEAEQIIADKDKERNNQQQTALINAKSYIPPKEMKKNRSERTADRITSYLELLKIKPSTSGEYADAIGKMVLLATGPTGKKPVLDMIFKFFVDNKNETFLNEYNALSSIVMLDKDTNLKVRLFYSVFFSLATGTATKQTISLPTLRSVFPNDDFVNWVAVKLPR